MYEPTQVPGTDWDEPQPMTTAAGGSHTRFCKKLDGTMWAWGQNNFGQLGLNTTEDGRSSPTQLPGNWANIYAGEEACYGVRTDGTFWSWGSNARGGLGLNQTSSASDGTSFLCSSPTQVGTDTTWSSLSATSGKVKGAVKTD